MRLARLFQLVLIAAVASGCLAPNAEEERKKLEQYDAGKPVPPIDEIKSNEPTGGD